MLYEGLFRLDETFRPEPWLCSKFSYDAETLTYTFTLRPGVTFSDGTPLTSEDVKASLEQAKTSPRYASRLSDVASIAAEEGAVTVTLSAPNTGFPALLDIPVCKQNPENPNVPIGTGPYLFSTEDSGAGLVANQMWWQDTHQPVDRIALVTAADHDTMLYRFTSREVQLIIADLTAAHPMNLTGTISYQDANTTIFQYLGCNVTREPLNTSALRQALSQGIHRSHITSAFLSGHADAAQFPVSPASALYPKALESRYSSTSFSEAVAETGYTSEQPLTLLVNAENSFKVSVAEYLAKQFTAGGVAVETRVLPWEEYTAALTTGDFDLYYGEVRLTADWDLSPLLSAGGSLNYGGWSNPRTEQLLVSYAASEDRSAAMRALCEHLQVQSPILPICFKSTSVLIQSDVLDGLTPTAAEPFYGLSCSIHLQEN